VPDKNYELWLESYMFLQNFNDKSFSVVGAAGYFGSAAVIESEFILLKNK
jgi:hypothetical protein